LFGNFNQSNLDATRRFLAAVANRPEYDVDLYSDVPKILLAKRGVNLNIAKFRGSLSALPLAELQRRLREYDVLVLTHGFEGAYGDNEYRTIFPTRTIPMLLSGRPILLHSPPNTFLTEFAKSEGFAEVVDEASTDKIIDALERIRHNKSLSQQLVANARKTSQQFEGQRVAEILRKRLEARD